MSSIVSRTLAGKESAQGIVDTDVCDIQPVGATPAYASPEQLRSLQIHFEQRQHPELLVNGPSSDLFSAGVVLFEQLTGVLPFLPAENIERSVPDSVPENSRERWREYEAMSQAHYVWVSMQHPAEQLGL